MANQDYLYIPFPQDLYDQLSRQLDPTESPPDAIAELVRSALGERGWRSDDPVVEYSGNEWNSETYGSPREGYQWGTATLPNGSRLRTTQRGKTHYAEVRQGEVIFNGETVSPYQFVVQLAGYSRDPWQNIWIQLPHESGFQRADEIRTVLEEWPKYLQETGREI